MIRNYYLLRSITTTGITLALMLSLSGCPSPGTRGYVVTIHNLSNQPLGPVAIATHGANARFWNLGEAASPGIKELAELGAPATLLAEFEASDEVATVVNGGIPFTANGRSVPRFGPFDDGGPDLTDTQVITIEGIPGQSISLASMLIGTNDGFWSVNAVTLPTSGSLFYFGVGFDAGTENNDELEEHIDDGASILGPVVIPGDEPNDEVTPDNGGVPTSPTGVITNHPGIVVDGDIPPDFDWIGPVTMVTITLL